MNLGDFDTGGTVYGKFTTYRPSTGAPFTLAGTPAVSVYKDDSLTQSTAGVTLTADFDLTGLNHYTIDTSADGTFYSAGSFFNVVITTGTVDSVSVVGAVVGGFTLVRDSALKPTTAARKLDVSAGGEAGIDWANIGSPTTAQNLSATNIDVDQIVASVSGAVASVTGNVGGHVIGTVGSVVGNVVGNVVGSVASVVAAVAITDNLKKNQALAGFEFVMTDDVTHAALAGLAVTSQMSQDGAAFVSTTNAASGVSNGVYKINLAAADTNCNVLTLRFTATGADDRIITLITQP